MKKYVVSLLSLVMLLYFSAAAQTAEWTWVVFINADNNLEGAGLDDLNEMEIAGSTDQVNIVVLLDRARGYSYDEGNWTGTRLFYVQKDPNMKKINSTLLKDYGELDMGDWRVLAKVFKDVVAQYPAKRYAVVLWNHGSGWKKKDNPLLKGISYDDQSGNHIKSWELHEFGAELVKIAGKKIDLFGMDACLMGMLEVAYELKDYADYLVYSEQTEPWDGWPHDDILTKLVENPTISTRDLAAFMAKAFVDSYNYGSQGHEPDVTQSAIDLSKIDALADELDEVAKDVINLEDKKELLRTMKYSPNFYYTDYKDLGTLLKRMDKFVDTDKALEAYKAAVVAAHTNSTRLKVTGMSIWVPKYASYLMDKYGKLQFSQDHLWDDMLADLFSKRLAE